VITVDLYLHPKRQTTQLHKLIEIEDVGQDFAGRDSGGQKRTGGVGGRGNGRLRKVRIFFH